jgi:hypothetical protein
VKEEKNVTETLDLLLKALEAAFQDVEGSCMAVCSFRAKRFRSHASYVSKTILGLLDP